MGRPTGYIGVVTSQPTVKWWANGSAERVHWSDDQSADRVHWSDDQSADSRVVGLMGRPTGYIGVVTSQPIGYEYWAIDAADSWCSDGTSLNV